VTVAKGHTTPLQKVLKGEKTVEIFQSGVGTLTITSPDGEQRAYSYPGAKTEVVVHVGELMRWSATENLMFAEVCYPPYQVGRFQNLD
jgi:hypothetical protein